MAAISASDVTYTIVDRKVDSNCRQNVVATIAFGDGALTYPSGGVPLTKASLACPNAITSLKLVDAANANGYVYKYDATNNKVRIYVSAALSTHTHSTPAHAHNLLLKNAAVADGATTRVNAGTDLLGANTGSDVTVAGAGANGGVQNSLAGTSGAGGSVSAAALSELGTGVAPAAATLYAEVIGW